ncbi:hypothetical protein EIP91_008233 [Steccherinum ochraceum]|uniref:ABC transporter domain-containing protein n=1 Tax=Steccherinum ochraceum TaxID=92696 RepID=A0A4R0RD94_9APHY|nr:hypothetical protein EIP91_008233 [Steccherinum ochraceum]
MCVSSSTPAAQIITVPKVEENAVGICAASFTWTADNSCDGTATPGSARRSFTLRVEDELLFKRGAINLIIGQTGSGKTSLFMALLGEMRFSLTGPNSLVSLPRAGGVAYHAQESWVLNDTIRNNILFGSLYDEERYNAVINQCGLKPDLALYNAGDHTQWWSEGKSPLLQKFYFLMMVLAALDVHTAKSIVEKCFRGELLRGRTVVLITHNVALMSPVADFVVSLGTDGRVLSQGTLDSALARDRKLESEVNKEREASEKEEQTVKPIVAEGVDAPKKPNGLLVVVEEIAVGHVGWSACALPSITTMFKAYPALTVRLYFSSLPGSTNPAVFWPAFAIIVVASKVLSQLDVWVLGLWAAQYETQDPSTVPVLSWLDKTPISRVLTRCTQDIAAIDISFPAAVYSVLDAFLHISAVKFGAVIVISPIFIFPGLLVIAVGAWFGHVYMRAQLPVKREASNAKAPVLSHFGSAIGSIVSIRAYGAEAAFRTESFARIDRYTRAQITFWNLNRWVGIRSSTLAGFFSSGLAAYLIYGPQRRASSTTGFSLVMAVGFSSMILWLEPKATEEGVPPACWPASGDLRVEKLSARYSPDGPDVLHDLTFHVKSGERIGIDYETDNIIQTSLRSKLDKDVTLLTVAHRLQTIMDSDRIMVLDSGRIAEFDKPSELLKNEKGLLRRLVDESGDRENLVAMASGSGTF